MYVHICGVSPKAFQNPLLLGLPFLRPNLLAKRRDSTRRSEKDRLSSCTFKSAESSSRYYFCRLVRESDMGSDLKFILLLEQDLSDAFFLFCVLVSPVLVYYLLD